MSRARGRISAKHALTPEEIEFCKVFIGFGSKNHTEAYRRAFLKRRPDSTYAERWEAGTDPDLILALPEVSPKDVTRRAKAVLKQDHIERYLEEILRPPGDEARSVLADQARFGSEGASRKAAEEILKQEDKLGFREAVDRWAEIMVEIGAEVEVPLPHDCPHCGKGLYASVLFADMFKKEGA